MKTRLLLLAVFFGFVLILLSGLFTPAQSHLSGAPAGRTGSPRDGSSCTSCHSPSGNFPGNGTITSNIPAEGYTAGQTYTVTATIIRAGHSRFGFEVSPQDTTSAHNITGSLIVTNSTTTKLTTGNTGYITQTSSGAAGTNNTGTWSFNWTAPATGKGPVVFYAAFLATNSGSNSGGDSLILANTKWYEAKPCTAPATPGTITGSTPVCAGSSNTYSVAAVNGATSYTWTLPNGWTGSSATNSITTTAGSTGGNISVTATNNCGTSSASTKAVTITTAPTTPGTINGSTPVCAGSSNTYSITTVSGATAYNWTLPNGWTGSSTTNSITTTAGNIGGNITVSATNSCGASSISTRAVNITAIPATPGTISGNTSVCASSSNSYSVSAVNGATGYTWTLPAGWLGTSTSNTITVIPTTVQQGPIQVQAINACGVSQASILNITSNIVIASVSLSSNAGNSVCSSQPVTFTANPVNGGTPSYQWQKNGVDVGGATASTFSDSGWANGDKVNVVMSVSGLNCLLRSTVYSDTVTLDVVSNALPAVAISANSGNSVCEGQEVTFTSTETNGGNAPSYQWLKNGNILMGDTFGSYSTNTLIDGDTISIAMLSNLECASTPFASSNAIVMQVNATVQPSINITTASDSTCSGQGISFTAETVNGGQSPLLHWQRNGSVLSDTSFVFNTSALTNGDTIRAIMESGLACVTQRTVQSNGIVVTVFNPVKPVVSFSNDTLRSTDAYSYEWMLNGTIIDETGQVIVHPPFGNYSVVTQDVLGCIDTSDVFILNVTDMGIGLSENGISIYPNPTDGLLHINLSASNDISVIKVYDLNGHFVSENHYAANTGTKLSLNLGTLSNGIYFLQLCSEEGNTFRRMVIER